KVTSWHTTDIRDKSCCSGVYVAGYAAGPRLSSQSGSRAAPSRSRNDHFAASENEGKRGVKRLRMPLLMTRARFEDFLHPLGGGSVFREGVEGALCRRAGGIIGR
ncbi:hypothetical protein MRX96_049127, partial [Rhipicephalus microplus]